MPHAATAAGVSAAWLGSSMAASGCGGGAWTERWRPSPPPPPAHGATTTATAAAGAAAAAATTAPLSAAAAALMSTPVKRSAMLDFTPFLVSARYADLRLLARGSYGVVARATDRATKQPVAIKKVHAAFDTVADARHLLREVRLLRHLRHPHVLPLLDVDAPVDYKSWADVYLVMPLLDTDLEVLLSGGEGVLAAVKLTTQLDAICRVVGTPPPSGSSTSRWYMRRAVAHPPLPIDRWFATPAAAAAVPDDAKDLMLALLRFDPAERLTAAAALAHPYVAEFADPADVSHSDRPEGWADCLEPGCEGGAAAAAGAKPLTREDHKVRMWAEISCYHPELAVRPDAPAGVVAAPDPDAPASAATAAPPATATAPSSTSATPTPVDEGPVARPQQSSHRWGRGGTSAAASPAPRKSGAAVEDPGEGRVHGSHGWRRPSERRLGGLFHHAAH
ncbi:hypothetical protein I4F81_009759 [Pyropia yezoensis]|uniref:Uncharacterized protein n=1 Tax=Pyropia yezoensis TaxID=2788 RepID=A0ACC3CBT8_PYRYE|nr:hypothetical protein I4F81_009759 [Neopyropia yezoensis]